MKIMLVISYDGSKFKGFQRQNDVRNVQGELEKALSFLYNNNILVKGSGRTDRGVHALNQVVHFECNKKVSNLKNKLNKILKDIYVKKAKIVDDNFHARHNVKEKIYLYKIDLSGQKDDKYYLIYKNKLNIKMMKEASKIFLGTHDFRNFTAGFRENYITTIFKIKIYEFKKVLYIKFYGCGFFRYMVRNLVGALLEIGKNKISIEDLNNMLEIKNDRKLPTVSPNGLYLYNIKY